MATVYLARDLKHDRNVALKVLKPELAAVVGAERFLSEIKVTANLKHPHIIAAPEAAASSAMPFAAVALRAGARRHGAGGACLRASGRRAAPLGVRGIPH